MMQALLAVLAANTLSVLAAKNQGILIAGRRLSAFSRSHDLLEPGLSFQNATQRCAELAANADSVKFELFRITGNPRAVDQFQCLYQFIPVPENHNGTSFQLLGYKHFSTCNRDCNTPAEFGDYIGNFEFFENEDGQLQDKNKIVLAETDKYLSLAECKLLANNHNDNLDEEFGEADPLAGHTFENGAARIMGIYHYTEPENAEGKQITKCYGLSEHAAAANRDVTEHWVGLLTPLRFFKHLPTADSYKLEQLSNVACNRKDIPFEFYNYCVQFSYNFDGTMYLNNLLPMDLPSVDTTRAIGYSQDPSIRYNKIGQSTNRVLPLASPTNTRVYEQKVKIFSSVEALKWCTALAVATRNRTFNLFLTDRGWQCRYIAEQVESLDVLSQAYDNVLQSYLYSAPIVPVQVTNGADADADDGKDSQPSEPKRARVAL